MRTTGTDERALWSICARFLRAYVTDTREIVFRASALSKRLPRALKSLRFCPSESPSLSSNRTRSFIAVMLQDPSFSFNARPSATIAALSTFRESRSALSTHYSETPRNISCRLLSIGPHFGREHGLVLRHGRIPMPPSQFAICQHLILLSNALIITARKVGRAFGQGREFDHTFRYLYALVSGSCICPATWRLSCHVRNLRAHGERSVT
jgi:hypothetical protein